MSHHTGQTSLKSGSHSDELQLALFTQQNKRLSHKILPFQITQYQHQDEFLNKANTLKYHCIAIEQQPLLSLPKKIS